MPRARVEVLCGRTGELAHAVPSPRTVAAEKEQRKNREARQVGDEETEEHGMKVGRPSPPLL